MQNHVHLSSMADTKANILIGACAVIFSLLIGHMQREGFFIPVAIMLVFTLTSAAAAIMAVMPKGQRGRLRVARILTLCSSAASPN